MWSGPRNVSTAMMYAWRQRSDTAVWDEPLYGHYLVATGIDHPDRDLVLDSVLTDQHAIAHEMVDAPCSTPVRFYKNMAHHLAGFERSLVDRLDSFLLTRDPRDQLPSLAASLGRVPTMRDAGFNVQVELVDAMLARGTKPTVVDSRELLTDPRSVLTQLCDALGLPFEEAMLSWPVGPKPEDGVWGRHWYQSVHASTGFSPHRPKSDPLPADLAEIYAACAPLYERLGEFAIRA
jgi:hypothetical protein